MIKQTYDGIKQWLPDNHRYKLAQMKDHFTSDVEDRPKPTKVNVEEQSNMHPTSRLERK